MFSKTFFTVVVLSATAFAQSGTTSTSTAVQPSGTGGAPASCIIQCVQPAAEAVGCSFTDIPCVCGSAEFQNQARECLESTCTEQEVQQALGLQAQQCGAIGVSATSGSVTGSATTAGSGSSTVPGASSTPTTPTSNTSSRPNSSSTTGSSGSPTTGTNTSPAAGSPSNAAVALSDTSAAGLMSAFVAGLIGLVL